MHLTPPTMQPQTSPLDILCKVAAAEHIFEAPASTSPRQPALPPMLSALTPPDHAPPFAPLAPTEPVLHHHVHHHHHHMHGTTAPRRIPRLSTSAPTYPSPLSDATHLPLPSAPFCGPSPPVNTPPSAHIPTLQRNASAPVLSGRHALHSAATHLHTHHHVLLPELGSRSLPARGSSSSVVPVPPRLPSRFAPLPAMHVPPLPRSAPPAYSVSPPYASSPPLRGAGSLKSMARKATGRRDSYTRFTAEEEAMLLDGVRAFGVGNWKKILNSYQFHWKRTAVDLKDKYRNITRAKMRRMNASSQSDLSSVGSEGDSAISPPAVGASPMKCSPLHAPAITASTFSPVSTPSGSIDGRSLEQRMVAGSGVVGIPSAMCNGTVDKKDHRFSG